MYKVYFRIFNNYIDAYNYCIKSDFDPLLMIEEIN